MARNQHIGSANCLPVCLIMIGGNRNWLKI